MARFERLRRGSAAKRGVLEGRAAVVDMERHGAGANTLVDWHDDGGSQIAWRRSGR